MNVGSRALNERHAKWPFRLVSRHTLILCRNQNIRRNALGHDDPIESTLVERFLLSECEQITYDLLDRRYGCFRSFQLDDQPIPRILSRARMSIRREVSPPSTGYSDRTTS